MRVMAIDYGDARTGVALSDPSGLLTGFTTVIHSRNRETVLAQLAALCKERGADRLVMGFPRNMDGTEGPRAALYREFAASLEEATGMPSAFGMSAGRRSRRIRSSQARITTAKSGRTPSMPWPPA